MTDAFKILSAALDEAIDDAKNPSLPRHQLIEEQPVVKSRIVRKKRAPRKLRAFEERRQIEDKALRKLRRR